MGLILIIPKKIIYLKTSHILITWENGDFRVIVDLGSKYLSSSLCLQSWLNLKQTFFHLICWLHPNNYSLQKPY